ncbi:carbohydrate binding domain-containing protein [Marinicrinis sediminis]|uniref:Carbohydrate binding domain-containing protein n=1 Tax=Marinicrinis sediminis TaxID=1652465 RepID=A0ABW5RDF3_9BACL
MKKAIRIKLGYLLMLALIVSSFVNVGGMTPVETAEASTTSSVITEHDTIYQIMVDRFHNGDATNDATGSAIRYQETSEEDFRYMKGGDWQGIIDKLPYIQGMGYTAIWISPVAEPQVTNRVNNGTGRNTAYHGYNVKDPNKANPYFGTKEKLKELVDEAHNLGIKVILDIVPNHIGDYMLGTNNYYDIPSLQPAAPFNNPSWYHHNGDIDFGSIDGDYSQAAQDYLENHDLAGLDDLDHDNPQAKQAIFDAIKYWFDYTGADGARVDAAKLIKPSVLRELELYIGKNTFGENFDGNAEFVSRWVGSQGEWGMLDFPLFFQVLNSFAYGQSFDSTVKQAFAQDYRYNGDENHMVTFIDNHDRNRFLTEVGGDVTKLQNAISFIYAARGVPVVFQGTEQNRGNANGQIITGGIADTWNRWSMVEKDQNGNVIQDYFDTNASTYQHIAKLNQIRKTYEALRSGKQREMWSSANLYAFSRRVDSGANTGQEVISVFSNGGGSQTQTIPLRAESTLAVGTVLTNQLNTNDTITVQSGGTTGKQITVSVGDHAAKIYAVQAADTQAPTVPQNVTASMNGTSVELNWSPSSDNVAVTGYEVYRDGALIATTTGVGYTDGTVASDTTYSYTIKALDAAANASALSAAVSITTPIFSTNTVTVYYKQGFANPNIHYRPLGGTWTSVPGVSMPAAEITGYNKITINIGSATQLEAVFNDGNGNWDNNNSQNYFFGTGTWTFDGGSISSGAPSGGDTQAPTAPTGLTATARSSQSIDLSWTAATDNVGVTGYEIFRNGGSIATTASTTYSDSGLTAGTTYTYTVKAYDAASNLSAASNTATATTATQQGNEVTIYYKQGFTNPNIHYRATGGNWTTVPGVSMPAAEVAGYNKITINIGSATQLEAVFNDGNGNWDNNNSQNYFFGVGTWTFNGGVISSGVPVAGTDSLTIVVQAPANTPSGANLYLAGNVNGWNAADSAYELTKNANGTYQITLNVASGTSIDYKITRGSWSTVEVNGNGSDISNRNYVTNGGAEAANITVQKWKDI